MRNLHKKISSNSDHQLDIVNEDMALLFFENKLADTKALNNKLSAADLLISFFEDMKNLSFYNAKSKRLSASKNALYSYLLKFIFKKWAEMSFAQLTQEGYSLEGYAFLVYGSVVRNTAPNNRSDIDVLMVCNNSSYDMKTIDTFNNRLLKFTRKLNLHIDFIHQNRSIGRKRLELEFNSLEPEERTRIVDSLIQSKILVKDLAPNKAASDSYRFNEDFENFDELLKQIPKDLIQNDKFKSVFTYLWIQTRVNTELRLHPECDEDYLNFLPLEITVPILIESKILVDQNSSFSSWKNTVFKNYIDSSRLYLARKVFDSSDLSVREYSNYNDFQDYVKDKIKTSSWYQELVSMHKYSKQTDKTYIRKVLLEGAYPELVTIFKDEYRTPTSSQVKKLITETLDLELQKLNGTLEPTELVSIVDKWITVLIDYFLYRNGNLPQRIITNALDFTDSQLRDQLSFEVFKGDIFDSLSKNSNPITLYLVKNDSEANENLNEQCKRYYATYLQCSQAVAKDHPSRWHVIKSEYASQIEPLAHELFKQNGYLIKLKQNLQRLVDSLEWAAKIIFFKKYDQGSIEGVGILYKEKMIDANDYRYIKALKRLTAFLRAHLERTFSSPINIGTLKNYFTQNAHDDLRDFLYFLNIDEKTFDQLTEQELISLFKKGLLRTYEIYRETERKLYQAATNR